ncbi:unnamed protein product [Pleuronectes platessa]|uniref:Uncharacterized protein n=1 Tax=Pleuronectes platessa TaxID=8262 RepID=A0A9N7UFS4_PLEPL|nr:unnamed protein product [Pleuronectes platessa]
MEWLLERLEDDRSTPSATAAPIINCASEIRHVLDETFSSGHSGVRVPSESCDHFYHRFISLLFTSSNTSPVAMLEVQDVFSDSRLNLKLQPNTVASGGTMKMFFPPEAVTSLASRSRSKMWTCSLRKERKRPFVLVVRNLSPSDGSSCSS